MISAMEQEQVSAVTTKESEVSQLKEQISWLTEQVAANEEGSSSTSLFYLPSGGSSSV